MFFHSPLKFKLLAGDLRTAQKMGLSVLRSRGDQGVNSTSTETTADGCENQKPQHRTEKPNGMIRFPNTNADMRCGFNQGFKAVRSGFRPSTLCPGIQKAFSETAVCRRAICGKNACFHWFRRAISGFPCWPISKTILLDYHVGQ